MNPDSMTLRDFASNVAATPLGRELFGRLTHYDIDALTTPDTVGAREAEVICRAASSRSLVNHCLRSYAWGALLALVDGASFDHELFYVAALLHDLGLTERYDTGRCFEVDGAEAARDLLTSLGWSQPRAECAAEAIYLHMHELPADPTPEALLLTLGTSADVSGARALEIAEAKREAILEMFPRLQFKAHFTDLFANQAARKPHCIVHTYMHELDLAERIRNAPYNE